MTLAKILKIDPVGARLEYIQEAANILRNGGLVIIPTETVYGIAANMLNKKAVERLYEIKQRPRDKLFSLHIANKEGLEDFAKDIPVSAYKLVEKFWPGPLTLILKGKNNGTIGLRMPDDEIALRVISTANVPVVCPSANISGKPAPVNFQDAIRDLDRLVDLAIDAGRTKLGIESSIVDLTIDPPGILREGAIKKEEIQDTAKKKAVLFVCTGNSCRSVMAKSLLEKRLRENGRRDIEVLSRGVMLLGGMEATAQTKAVLAKDGIDVSAHRSQRIDKNTIDKSDIILVMEKTHEERVLQMAPEAKNRVFLLKEFAKIDAHDGDLEIADPIGKSMEFYEQTLDIIKEAVERIVSII